MPVTLADEQQLLEKARLDPVHFGPLYDAYYPRIFGYVYRRTADYDLARDIAADTFLKAVIKLPRFQWRGVSVSAWLFRIATNNCIDFIRKKRVQTISIDTPYENDDGDSFQFDIKDPDDNPDELMLRKQRKEYLSIAVQKLPEKYTRLVDLRYFKELSYEEVAVELELPLGTVKAQLFRARELLATELKYLEGKM